MFTAMIALFLIVFVPFAFIALRAFFRIRVKHMLVGILLMVTLLLLGIYIAVTLPERQLPVYIGLLFIGLIAALVWFFSV
jgi:hypothetical protein